ncbi:MAG: hypothetical protein C0417_08265 [Chlorobiaceae bacterium]|nr:hypothetical protein [Chlorobiaceae bacterium]
MNNILIKTFPRIHITLIGMNEGGFRRHGGIGFSVSEPCMELRGFESKEFHIDDNRKIKLEFIEYRRLIESLNNLYTENKFNKKISITIDGEVIPHYGFGSETALRLASLEMLSLINNYQPDKNELIHFSGRGGVSGIGINTYFNGGFILDSGVKGIFEEYKPSNQLENRKSLPLLIHRQETENWELGLYVNSDIKSLSEVEETIFFQNSCPILDYEAYEILYVSVYGCLSAGIEKDKIGFCNAINRIQTTKWKALERKLYNNLINENEKSLFIAGATAVGMSSLGPLLYFFSDKSIEEVISQAKIIGLKGRFYRSSMTNYGRVIQYE